MFGLLWRNYGIKYSNVRRTEEGDSGASICLYKHFVERATDKTHEKLVCTSNFVTFKHKIIPLYCTAPLLFTVVPM